MPKIEQLPSGSFRARVFVGTDPDGKKRYKSITGYSKKDVKLKMAEFEASKSTRINAAEMTLRETMEKYIEDRSAMLSAATIKGYYAILNNRLKSIMNIPISKLTLSDVQTAFNEDKKRLKHKTIMNTHGLFTATIASVDDSITFDITLSKKEESKIEIPTEAEMQRIFEGAKGLPIETPIYLGAMCGMRRSEICALKWDDIDFEKNLIHIHSAIVLDKDNNIITKGTKTESSTRTIRAFAPVMEHLKSLTQIDEMVCHFGKPNNVTNQFKALLRKIGVPNYRFHDLRHYAVSTMLMLNMPKHYVSWFMGHSTTDMVDKVYAHSMRDKKYQIMDAVDDYFSEKFAKDATKDDTD